MLEIKDSLKLSSAAVSRMAVRLENKDCKPIIRYHSDDNQKAVCLKMTTSGVKQFKEISVVVEKILDDFFTSTDFVDLRDMILNTNIHSQNEE